VSVTDQFRELAEAVVDDQLVADPVTATWLGDHRFDDRLPDLSEAAVAGLLLRVDDQLTALDAVDDVELEVDDLVDLEILRARLLRTRFDLGEVRRQEWDPMAWNPGTALHLLLEREFAPADERAASLRGRLAAVPDLLGTARARLGDMPEIHVETAIGQLAGTRHLIDGPARRLAADDALVDDALRAVREFTAWLESQQGATGRSPRLGERLYGGALWHALDDDTTPAALLADAYGHLSVTEEELVDVARRYLDAPGDGSDADIVRAALDDVCRSWPVDDATVLPLMEQALDRTTAFVRERGLVTIPEVDTRIIEMPEIHRGIAVAYCDAPGPLERADVATFVAVAPTPADWAAERVASFYREYNGVALHDLAVHEAMPGHVLQLAHAGGLVAPTRVRAFGRSGVFVEGWAVYAEELMVARGYAPAEDERSALALRLVQLKMQLRMTINAILDVGVHAEGMTEDEGLALMRERGFQEEGEAVGKWRRALLTATQLPTYFVGYRAMAAIAADLRVLHPDWSDRQVHDLMLSHGSPAPRHLRTLLGI
jgi:uncharacterized protein (DUF885 family)